jgi:hypothetical protein
VGAGSPPLFSPRALRRRPWNDNRVHGAKPHRRAFPSPAVFFITLFQVELFLFDVSESAVFAIVYGVLLIAAGLAIGRKVRPDSLAELRTMDRQRLAVLSFAICVVSSGFFCFILEREWLSVLSTAVKIPMYMVLGTSSCFAISFSVIDTVNTGCCTPDESDGEERLTRAIVSSPSQIYSILVGSVAMGAVFGFMFGYVASCFAHLQRISISNNSTYLYNFLSLALWLATN